MKKVGIIRGKFLTKYDMEPFELLSNKYNIIAYGSKNPMTDDLVFPVKKLWSPMDLPEMPYKLPVLNRVFIDAHYLLGLEDALKGVDIAHSAETYFNYTRQALNAKRKGHVKKVVISVLENIPFNNEGIVGRKRFKKRALEEADHFIALSRGAKDALIKEGAPENKISRIGFGINTNKFYPGKNKNKRLNILFAGRIEMYKGIFDVVKVFSMVVKEHPNIKLTIVGNGSKEDEVKQLVNDLGLNSKISMRAVPYEEMAVEYKKADIFFAPSRKDKYWVEQFGMVFLEAMASGLPIITTGSGAIPEVVGETAFLAKEGNIKDMNKHLLSLITDSRLRVKMGKDARKRAEKEFDIRVIAKKIDKVYQSLII